MKLPIIAQSQLDVSPLACPPREKRYMNPGELEVLVALIASVRPKAVAEFGVNEGRTARAILDNVPGIEAYEGWDVLPGYKFTCEVQANEVPAKPGWLAADDPRFRLHLSSGGTRDLVGTTLAPLFDAIFIDGDHSRAAVENDTALARAMVRPGGMIIWHDYHDRGNVDVRDVLDEMHAAGDEIYHVEGTWLAFQRIGRG